LERRNRHGIGLLELTGQCLALVAVISSGSPAAGAPGGAGTPSLEGTAWALASLSGKGAIGDARPTARFEGGRVLGSDGCNRYSADFRTQASSLQMGPRAASTLKACREDVMSQAKAFMNALDDAASYRLSDGRLELMSAQRAVVASFTAQSSSLAATSWRVTALDNGKGGVSGMVVGSRVTMELAADGRVWGSGGCNRYTSSYRTDGTALAFTPAAATRMACAAAGVMEQEQAFFRALESVATMRMEGERLELRSGDGALAIILDRAAPR
jgi:heat shock protein HslJ